MTNSAPEKQTRSLCQLVAVGLCCGLLSAVLLSFGELRAAWEDLGANEYLQNSLYHLAASVLREPLLNLAKLALLNSLIITLLLYLSSLLLCGKKSVFFISLLGLGIILLIAAGTVVTILSKSPSTKQPNVILIVIDALRADHLGSYGYERNTSPNLDAFAKENTKYENAIAPSPWTLPSIAAYFSGFYPSVTGINAYIRAGDNFDVLKKKSVMGISFDKSFLTLAEILKNSGYQSAAVSANPLIHEYLGFAQGFDHYTISRQAWNAAKVNKRVLETLRLLKKKDNPFFLYIHYFDPHEQYRPPSEYNIFKGSLKAHPYEPEVLDELNRYDGEILFCDKQIGLLIEELKSRDLYEDSIVIITSDHGEQFKEHGRLRHGHSIFNQELNIPLMIKAAGIKKGSITSTVSGLDIFPTILDLVDIAPPQPVQGYSLASQLKEREEEGVFAGGTYYTHEKAYISNDGKKLRVVFDGKRHLAAPLSQARDFYVYDSRKDLLEQHPIPSRSLTKELYESFKQIYKKSLELRAKKPIRPTKLKETNVKQLRALGYLE